MLLLIDNYDSFTHNLARYFIELGQVVQVVRNDEITCQQIETLAPDYLVLSPGPCTPNEAGITLQAIEYFAGKLPILGVCLGHQAIAQVFGASVVPAQQVRHGKASSVVHKNSLLFKQVEIPFQAIRYHSLLIAPYSIPDCFEVTAWCNQPTLDNNCKNLEIMAIEHVSMPIYGVQFHPESLLTEFGHQILKNYLNSKVPTTN